jgi:hypothetical protein
MTPGPVDVTASVRAIAYARQKTLDGREASAVLLLETAIGHLGCSLDGPGIDTRPRPPTDAVLRSLAETAEALALWTVGRPAWTLEAFAVNLRRAYTAIRGRS